MDRKAEMERRKYLALETYYLKSKQLLEDLEKKLNLKSKESDTPES